MLVIDLERLLEAPLEVQGDIAADDPLWHGSDLELAIPLTASARAESAGAGAVHVTGSFRTRIRTACRRCLKPLERDVSEQFDLVFDPRTSAVEEDLTLYRLNPDAETLDLKDVLRERVLLLTDAGYPVCREECRGLCTGCGAELNFEECTCEEPGPDPRWGPLLAARPGRRGSG